MAERNINNVGLAAAIDTSHVAIGHWTRGERFPNYGNCIKLARYFHIPEEDILIIAGHRQPHLISDSPYLTDLGEPQPTYATGPRAHLDTLLDQLTDDQVESLITFLEALR